MKANVIFRNLKQSLLIVTFLLLGAMAQAIPTLSQFEATVSEIISSLPATYGVHINREQEINRLLALGDPNNDLADKAYQLAHDYMQADHWQEAIWTLKRTGLMSYGLHLEKVLSHVLENGQVNMGGAVGKGVNYSTFGAMALSRTRSIKVIIKSADSQAPNSLNSEVWAHQIDDLLLLNVVPIAVRRQIGHNQYSVHLLVPDATDSGLNFRDSGYQTSYPEIYFLDFLIGNVDRHYENSMFSKSGRLFAIDHGRGLYTGVGYVRSNIHTGIYQKNYVLPALILQRVQELTTEQFVVLLRPLGLPEIAINYLKKAYEQARTVLSTTQFKPLPVYLNHGNQDPLENVVDFKNFAQKQLEEQHRVQQENIKLKKQQYSEELGFHSHAPILDAQNKAYVKRGGYTLTENGHRFLALIQLADIVKSDTRDTELLTALVNGYKASKLGYRDFRRLYAEILERPITPGFMELTKAYFSQVAPLNAFFTDDEFRAKYQDPKHVSGVFLGHFKELAAQLPAVMSCRFVYR